MIKFSILIKSKSFSRFFQDQYIHHLYASMKEAYRMLGIDSITEVKLKTGANSDLSQPPFQSLGGLMFNEQQLQNKELSAVQKLEDFFSHE